MTSACLRGGGVSPCADGPKVTVDKDEKSPSYTPGGFVWGDRPFYLVKWPQEGMADTHEYWSKHGAHLVYLPIFHGLTLIIFS